MHITTDEMRTFAAVCGVQPEIHSEDFIYQFLMTLPDLGHRPAKFYFSDGPESAQKLRRLIEAETNVSPSDRFSLLEFASGYGCVTRLLNNVMPSADITACDIHPQAMDFISSVLGMQVKQSVSSPAVFDLAHRFDIVFALSFFSHMPKSTFGPWVEALFRHVRPGGSLIFTTHGEVSLKKIWKDDLKLDGDGFWFRAESEQLDLDSATYGTTICTPAYVTRTLYKNLKAPLALLHTGFWWEHQDVYVVAKPQS